MFQIIFRMPTFTCASSINIDELLKVPNHEFMIRLTSYRSVQMNATIPRYSYFSVAYYS